MTFSGGKVLKRLPSRTITKVELPNGNEINTFFLKRHIGVMGPLEMLRTLFSGFSLSWGRKEWEVIDEFRKCGIPTLAPVAAGEKVSLLRQESFLMTEELTGFQSLDRCLQEYFFPPLPAEKIIEKRVLIKELAQIAKRMHDAGFNHRDFYCCHIFIRRTENRKREWRVLDLQRVDKRRWFRRRWIIKDLAALNYSASPQIMTTRDRMRFLTHYLDGKDNVRQNLPFIRQVIIKTEKISHHDKKIQARKRN
jgi:heptose I phosphotransferase